MLAHNTATSGDGTVPVVIENPDAYPFADGEREREWHPCTEGEYARFVAYWNARYDAEEGRTDADE